MHMIVCVVSVWLKERERERVPVAALTADRCCQSEQRESSEVLIVINVQFRFQLPMDKHCSSSIPKMFLCLGSCFCGLDPLLPHLPVSLRFEA